MTRQETSGNLDSRTISVIASPNGAGKSTFFENYFNRYVDCDEFLNADLIARGHSSMEVNTILRRGKPMIRSNPVNDSMSMDEKVAAARRDAGRQSIEVAERTGTSIVVCRMARIPIAFDVIDWPLPA